MLKSTPPRRKPYFLPTILAVLAVVSATSYMGMRNSSFQNTFLGAFIGILDEDLSADMMRKSLRLDFSDLELATVTPSDRQELFSDDKILCGQVEGTGGTACALWTEIYASVEKLHGVTQQEIEEKQFKVSRFALSTTDSGAIGKLTLISVASGAPTIVIPE